MFDLGQDVTGDGISLREHYERASATTGRRHPKLDLPPIPDAFVRAMRIWQDLHRNRQTGMGLGNLTWPDFHAYAVMAEEKLTRDDIELVRVIDDEFHASRAAAEERRNKKASR